MHTCQPGTPKSPLCVTESFAPPLATPKDTLQVWMSCVGCNIRQKNYMHCTCSMGIMLFWMYSHKETSDTHVGKIT